MELVVEKVQLTKVLLVERQALVRRVLRLALEAAKRFEVADVGDRVATMATATKKQPHVIVLDAELLTLHGVGLIGELRTAAPGASVIVMASGADEGLLVRSVQAGASGFLTKGESLAELVEAVDSVRQDGFSVPPAMLRSLISTLVERQHGYSDVQPLLAKLTRQERRVLGLLAQGGTNDDIGQALVISPQTARTHVSNILSKVGAHSRLEAVALVLQHDLMGQLEGELA